MQRMELRGWRVVGGRSLDARTGVIYATGEGKPAEELFRWTLAGRSEFVDYAPNVLKPVEMTRLPRATIFVLFPPVQVVLPIPVQPLA